MKGPAIPGSAEIAAALNERFPPFPAIVYEQLANYLTLLYRWNQRMNLTAVRDPETMLHLHLPECILCGLRIPAATQTVLDFGSGAGLPGIPIQIVRPELLVTLGESQSKKAAFLREAVRELSLKKTKVAAQRVESLPTDQKFDVIALRAVDQMQQALQAAASRIAPGGACMVLTSATEKPQVEETLPGLHWTAESIPDTRQRVLMLGTRTG
jgi:16S rRNA (guanine527-N7)-methyltransferase